MNYPDKDGFWEVRWPTSNIELHAQVSIAKNEVCLPTGEAPYRLSDLPEGEWTFVSDTLPPGW